MNIELEKIKRKMYKFISFNIKSLIEISFYNNKYFWEFKSNKKILLNNYFNIDRKISRIYLIILL